MAIKGQEEGRRMEQFVDKVGRLYEANIEISTGDPCEVLRPVGWAAPSGPSWFRNTLTPPCDDREIVSMVPRLQRARKGYQVEINYVRWLQKWDEADEAYTKKIAEYAQGMTKGRADLIAWIQNPPVELLKLVGRGPRNVPRVFIEAAAAGNPWALGLTDTVPSKAQLLLNEIRPLVEGKRKKGVIGLDPFADDDDENQTVGASVAALADPLGASIDDELDGLLALEEQFDPNATGGTTVTPPRRRHRKRESAESDKYGVALD